MENEESIDTLLDARRSILVGNDIDEKLCQSLRQRLVRMALEGSEPIRIFIDSDGGNSDASLQLHDLIRALPVHTIGLALGECHSSAVAVLQGCTERMSLPHARFLIHSATLDHKGWIGPDRKKNRASFSTAQRLLAETQKNQEAVLRKRSRISPTQLRMIIRAGDDDIATLSAQEALRLGLIDRIVVSLFPPADLR